MKARELRIGNLVEVFKDTYYPIVGISIENAYVSNKMGVLHCSYIELEPIPLTEEWLVKFGFKKEYDNYWSHKKSYFEIDKDNEGLWINSVNGNEYHHGNGFNHVHQLQNLYFALTGEELTTTPQ